MSDDLFSKAAEFIQQADGLLITAGAGMGVDSGLPDFRGSGGFWKHYPALAEAGQKFSDIACPQAFEDDQEQAWGFYGHRLDLYRRTVPHRGFEILRNIADRLVGGAFVFTSNVDGQFQKAGFPHERIYECHGSIHHLQCFAPCTLTIWDATFVPIVDAALCRMTSALPRCPECDRLARPNVMMFHDWGWNDERARNQSRHLRDWRIMRKQPVVIELGAGADIPTVRMYGEGEGRWAPLIRINPREPNIPKRIDGVSLAMGAREAMEGISDALSKIGFWAIPPAPTF
jgi:NAD-dependent SIR2 family protein deacetylase